MPYSQLVTKVETVGRAKHVKRLVRLLRIRSRLRNRHGIHLKRRLRRAGLLRLAFTKIKHGGSRKGVRHHITHRVVRKHYTRRHHTDRKRVRHVHVHRKVIHHLKRRVVRKGFHHRKHSHVTHHAHRPHKGYHGHRVRRKKR